MVKFRNSVFNSLALIILLLAVFVGGLRLGISNIDLLKTEIEFWLAKEVIPGVSFVSLVGGWNQLNPILRLNNASITLPDRSQPLVIDNIYLEFDLYLSLMHGTAVVREATGNIDKISIRRDRQKSWWLNDINLLDAKNNDAMFDFNGLLEIIPYYLRFNVSRLIIEDETNSVSHQIDDIHIDVAHFSETIQLQVAARLPDAVGDSIDIRSILTRRNSLVYINSRRLRPGLIGRFFDLNIEALSESELATEIWIDIADNKVQAVTGNLDLSGLLTLDDDRNAPASVVLSGQFQALHGRYARDWLVSSHVNQLHINKKQWNSFDVGVKTFAIGGRLQIDGLIDRFDLTNLRPPPEFGGSNWIKQGRLKGNLSDIRFSLNSHQPGNLAIAANFDHVTVSPVGKFPGIENLRGAFVYGNNRAEVKISANNTRLDYGDEFRAPFELTDLNIRASASLQDNNVQLSVSRLTVSNKDISLNGRLWLETDGDNTPFMYLRANFQDGKGSSASKYLPLKLLPSELLAWLDESIIDAQVSNGELIFHGRLNNIFSLTRRRAGELYVGFDLNNAEVRFDPAWASASNARGRALFHNMSMQIGLENVSYGLIPDAAAEIKIADFSAARLELDIVANTSAANALETWIKTPVGTAYSRVVSHLEDAQGRVTASLGIVIPFEVNSDREVNVGLNFEDAAVKAPDWGVELSRINGLVKVTENSVEAEALKAFYFKDAISVGIETDPNNAQTIIHASGSIDSQQILHQLPEALMSHISGNSSYDVDIFIPGIQSEEEQPIVRIEARSHLRQTRINLPEPFRKRPADDLKLSAQINIFDSETIEFRAYYGADISASGKLIPDSNRIYQLTALDLGFSSPLKTNLSSGIRVYGTTPYLALNDWISLVGSFQGSGQLNRDNTTYLETLDLRIGSMLAFNRLLENTDIFLIRAGNSFQGNIKSSMLKGEISIPWQQSEDEPVVLELEFLKLISSSGDAEKSDLLPSYLPNIKLTSKIFEYDDIKLSDLALVTRVNGELLEVDSLTVKSDKILLQCGLKWEYNPVTRDHHSSLKLSLTGTQFGQSIAAAGFGDIMLNGEINLSAQVEWFSPLFELDWKSLLGEATLEISDGILKDVDQGAGRFVGLLSLNALPRRLFLDFSDIIVAGLEFDEIKGTYLIVGENIFTEDTMMDGASALVKIYGKTGLKNRDYDQKMVITPKVRQTLPVIGSLAAGNAVGWGLLLLQNLFKKEIDKSVEIEYRISGSWDDPKVELVTDLKAVEERIKNDK